MVGCASSPKNVTNGKIVFQSDRDGNYDLYIMNPNGSDQQNLTNSPPSITSTNNNTYPIPSPDGKSIAFESDRDGNREIYVIDVENRIQINLTKNKANDYSPTWSPDGKSIAFISDRDAVLVDTDHDIWTNNIYIMAADGSNPRRLTSKNKSDGYGGLSWSPDGSKLALCLSSPTPWDGYFSKGINLLTISDSSLTRLTFDQSTLQCNPKWSPDGKRILFSLSGSKLINVYLMNADGTNQIALSTDPLMYDIDPSWSLNGDYVLFSSNRDGNYHIYTMKADGTNLTRLTDGPGEETNPVWLPVSPP